MMTRVTLLLCIGSCAVMLFGAFAAGGQWVFALFSLIMGAAWLLVEWRGWGQLAPPGMAFMSILSAAAILSGTAPDLMVFTTAMALSAWDLSRFRRRLTDALPGNTRRSLETRHLQRLLIVDAIGIAIAMLATRLHLLIGFYLLFIVGALVLVLIYQVLKRTARLVQ